MSFKLARELGELLAARKFPIKVEYGPPRFPNGRAETHIQVSRDRTGSDTLAAPNGYDRNARVVFRRDLAVQIVVWAKSAVPNAHVGNHEDLCEALVDGVLTALDEWFRPHVGIAFPGVTEARYIAPHDVDPAFTNPEQWPGVIYRIKFRVPRAVRRVTFAGEGLPEGSAGATHNTVRVRRNGADPPEEFEIPGDA